MAFIDYNWSSKQRSLSKQRLRVESIDVDRRKIHHDGHTEKFIDLAYSRYRRV